MREKLLHIFLYYNYNSCFLQIVSAGIILSNIYIYILMNDRIIALKQILIIESILSYGAAYSLMNFVYFSSPDGSTWLLVQFK